MRHAPPPGGHALERKKRVLNAACQLFARRGFEGTHVREVCNLAGVNIALVFYHFRDKRGLYEAVRAEAREQLSRRSGCSMCAWRNISPEQKIQAIIESLFARLSGDSAWIARLVARELAGETQTSQGMASEAFRDDLTLLESAIRDAAGPKADANTVRLDALSVLSQCVFHCAARRTIAHFSPELDEQALQPKTLMRHLTLSSLRGLGNRARFPRAWPRAPGEDAPGSLQDVPMGRRAAVGRGSPL